MSAGYSGTPLPKKLGVKPGSKLRLVDPPSGFREMIGFPREAGKGDLPDLVIAFCLTLGQLEEATRIDVEQDGAIWIAWPKKASKVPTEITEDRIRDVALPTGLVDVKVCAIDAVWSGLKLVWRKGLRPKKP